MSIWCIRRIVLRLIKAEVQSHDTKDWIATLVLHLPVGAGIGICRPSVCTCSGLTLGRLPCHQWVPERLNDTCASFTLDELRPSQWRICRSHAKPMKGCHLYPNPVRFWTWVERKSKRLWWSFSSCSSSIQSTLRESASTQAGHRLGLRGVLEDNRSNGFPSRSKRSRQAGRVDERSSGSSASSSRFHSSRAMKQRSCGNKRHSCINQIGEEKIQARDKMVAFMMAVFSFFAITPRECT